MAAVATAAEISTELMSKLSLDAKSKTHDAPEIVKKGASANSKGVPSALSAPFERSLTPLLQECIDSNMCYLPSGQASSGYYYGGYDGSMNEWNDHTRYVNHDGVEMLPPVHVLWSLGIYGDMYHHGYRYAPYGAYSSPGSPVPNMGSDGQLYQHQHYQYPATYYQPHAPQTAPFNANQARTSQGQVSTSVVAGQTPISVDPSKTKSNGIAANTCGNSGSAPPKSIQENPSAASSALGNRGVLSGVHSSSGYHNSISSFDAIRSPEFPDGQHKQATNGTISSSTSQFSNPSAMRNQNLQPLPHLAGMHSSRPSSGMGTSSPGLASRVYPNNQLYSQYGNGLRTAMGFGANFYDSRTAQWGLSFDSKYRPRGRGNGFYCYGNENLDGMSELNIGPRAGHFRNPKGFGSSVTIAVKGQNLSSNGNVEDSSAVPVKDQLNHPDFPEKYSDAKFFIIKSYSEDDVHKSIKYSVWASTPSGNKKLHDAYQEAQKKSSGCPIFLYFSVNTSGQFVGVAEMVGPVDFNKTVEYWQQDKWTGCFPVKWHIVKDVPNNILKHITLENNDNKPVTNSRDTQEVRLEQGLQMFKIFKVHTNKTSVLDDFSFYETREKAMQEKRAKQQQIQKQVVDGRQSNAIDDKDVDGAIEKPRLQMPLEFVTILKKECASDGLVERKPSNGNCMGSVAGDAPKLPKLVAEKRNLANGNANVC